MDENYVAEILASMPAGLTRDQFTERCVHDINGGYAEEVIETAKRYFRRPQRRRS